MKRSPFEKSAAVIAQVRLIEASRGGGEARAARDRSAR
jgi:hypothetical protein